jgi:transposase InsO family protein
MAQFMEMIAKASMKDEDSKTIKIPPFSDGTDWESVVFELECGLEKYWKHDDLDIVDYLQGIKPNCAPELIAKADKIIYNALVTASKRDSFARKQIMASRHTDAVPQVERNEGLKLFNLFQTIFTGKSKNTANLPSAQTAFYQIKMQAKEQAKDYIARVDTAVSDLAMLNEKVSNNSWRYILANGLRPDFKESKAGVLFSKTGYDTVIEVKNKILEEETINGIGKPDKADSKTEKDYEIAHAVFEGKCHYCDKKGHKKPDCRQMKKDKAAEISDTKSSAAQYWCDICYKAGHSTDYCSLNPSNKGKGKGKKGKLKGSKGKGKGSKSKPGKGGRGQGNFPAAYTPEVAQYTNENWASTKNWSSTENLNQEESSSSNWYDLNLSVFEENRNVTPLKQNLLAKSTFDEQKDVKALIDSLLDNEDSPDFPSVFKTENFQDKNATKGMTDFCLVLLEENDVTAWTQTNAWTELDFKFSTWGDQPTFAAAQGGPGCDSLLNVWDKSPNHAMKQQLDDKLKQLKESEANGETGLWMYLDSGASRSVIQEKSPIRPYLSNVTETDGSCNVGNGANLKYLEKGMVTLNNEVTVVKDLKYDLYAAVAAAKRGVSCVLDFDSNGDNKSYLFCKTSGNITPLIERRKGILEVPVHLYINNREKGLMATDTKLSSDSSEISMATISKFWLGMDQCLFDPVNRAKNSNEMSLFMFDIINSLGEKQKDFLIHARLAHLPRKAILQLVKNGAKGIPYKGKFKELCRPCLEARHKAENHGKQTVRNPNGKIGEHLHSDLAVVNLKDFNGFNYVLTVVDEISDEVVVTLLKTRTAENVLKACKKTLQLITARSKNSLKSWQFDRGGEFLNQLFEDWILRELGARQLFSNVEHPWENGRAERSFSTIFQKARAMLKYADLPNGIWGKAVMHAVYLKNRCPSTRINYLSPLQFRTGEATDFTRLRVFGCPAQIFIRSKERLNNKVSSRSEQGTFIGMSQLGNGFIFRVRRTNQTFDIDSADAKFNETFSDCRDRQGRIIKGGRVLEPDLVNELDMAADIEKMISKWTPSLLKPTPIDKPSKFSSINRYENQDDYNNNDDEDDNSSEQSEPEKQLRKSFNAQKTTEEPMKNQAIKFKVNEPMKMQKQKSREIKALLPSKGFQSDKTKTPTENQMDQSASTRPKRATTSRSLYEPNFEPTHKRKQLESTMFIEDEEDDLTNLDPDKHTFDQILNCMEQGIKAESGKLADPNEELLHHAMNDIGGPDPKSQKAIDRLPEKQRKRYNDATAKEFEGMKKKEVMEFVRMSDVPSGAKIYICIVNWVTKYVLGVYQKTKCRICFGGHHYNKLFTDCFAPTVNFTSVLIMLCLAAMFGWHLGSLDYSQAYLNANIDEECFLRAPEFLRQYDHDGVELIWRLKKVIYGHPKGSRLWAACLNDKLKALGFKQFATDQCVYGKWLDWNLMALNDKSYFVFVLVHSDDVIIISNKKSKMNEEKERLLNAFEGIDQGDLKSFCGVEIDISDTQINLSMEYYWRKVMKRFQITAQDKNDSPIKTKICRNDCPVTTNEKTKQTYLQMIGSIIFGYTHCRLDLAFPIGMFTRVMHSPSEGHLKQLIEFLKYLNATMKWKLKFFRDNTVQYGMKFVFFAYCDSSHADDLHSFRSTGGWFFFLRKGQGCVSSKSGQTADVALSSTEAETIWACSASTQGSFIKQFLDELQIFGETTFELLEDSQPAINAQRKNVSQSRFRHIKIKYHYIRQLITEGWCKLIKINTKDQVADIATKILNKETVLYFSNIILGNSVAVDQSLNAYDTEFDNHFNDWGVVSAPDFTCMYA